MTTAIKPVEDVKPSSVVFTDVAYSTELLTSFSSLREQEELSDVVICVGGSRVPTHRLILAGSSPYFRAMFTSKMLFSFVLSSIWLQLHHYKLKLYTFSPKLVET